MTITLPRARTQLLLLLISPCLLAAGCVRAGFTAGRSLDSEDGAARDVGPDLRVELGADIRLDLPDAAGADAAGADAAGVDAAVPHLSCKAPVVVGSSPPGKLQAPALRVDALELIANKASYSPSGTYSTKRSATDQPFGAWSLVGALRSDPTFFEHKSVERAINVDHNNTPPPRQLQLCAPLASCTKFPVIFASSGKVVTVDMDGPSVAITAKGPLMAHNINTGDGGDIYLATPIDATDLLKGWTTTVVPALAQPGYKEDDPSLSPDGLVLVFSAPTPAGDRNIWYSARATLTDVFSAPAQLAAVNSSSDDDAPCLAEVTIKGKTVLELYVSSDRSGIFEIYRAECSY